MTTISSSFFDAEPRFLKRVGFPRSQFLYGTRTRTQQQFSNKNSSCLSSDV
eukprot:jgi/Psemu1/301282/fgenesh1_kg.29_\